SVALVFVFSLPVSLDLHHYYLGQFPANVWHNSTTILAMPLVVLAFGSCCHFLSKPDVRVLLRLVLWSVLMYIIKPSFIPVLVVAFPLFTLFRFGFTKPLAASLVYSLLLGLLLIFPLIFISGGSDHRVEQGGVEMALFKVWSLYSDNYLLSLVATLLFPLTCFLLYTKQAIKDDVLLFCWACWVISFGMFATINETGGFLRAGNFGWQVIMASYLLFLTSLVFFNKRIAENASLGWKEKTIGAIFILHFVSGVFYLIKLMFLGYQ
ncbi:MAG: hypothetical protein HWE07_14390, partial [Cytophagia bacterium]|nr:hypothetical protein [Cytophagia bacterium]